MDVGWPVDDVLRALAVQTGTSPRIVQRINDFSVTEELVAAGVGIALLPRYSTDDRGGRRLARRPVAGVRAARVVEAVLRTSTAQRPRWRRSWTRCAPRPPPSSGRGPDHLVTATGARSRRVMVSRTATSARIPTITYVAPTTCCVAVQFSSWSCSCGRKRNGAR